MAAITNEASPLTPRTGWRNVIIQLHKEMNALEAISSGISAQAIELSKRAMRGPPGPRVEMNVAKRCIEETSHLLTEVIGCSTAGYFKAGGSLQLLAEALSYPPEEKRRFIEKFTPTYREHSPHPNEL